MDFCKWNFVEDSEGSGHYETGCGNGFFFVEGNTVDNDFHYCPYCGKVIREE